MFVSMYGRYFVPKHSRSSFSFPFFLLCKVVTQNYRIVGRLSPQWKQTALLTETYLAEGLYTYFAVSKPRERESVSGNSDVFSCQTFMGKQSKKKKAKSEGV